MLLLDAEPDVSEGTELEPLTMDTDRGFVAVPLFPAGGGSGTGAGGLGALKLLARAAVGRGRAMVTFS
jgi:hypothetical protein